MLGPGCNNLEFINFIPTNLHTCLHVEERFMGIDNIIFMDNPTTSYLWKEVVARFKTVTGPQDFVLEKDAAKLPNYVTDEVFYEVIAREGRSEGQPHFSVPCRGSHGRKCNISVAFSPLNTTGAAATCSAGVGVVWNAEVKLAGSITGRVTLAEFEDYYLFNVSPPGVRIDQMEAAAFSCEFNMDGEVLIEGEIATGGNTVESRTGNPCPPGHFSLRFQLPGSVYPRRANCNFRSDGIFEGIVKKQIKN
ncbi:increased DNA methylation 2-like [Eucalyptus grandis]|uniref:increased DNA methylation 2-like n=1 Tax=Eucalyptus grandis TaxID=71139 RepID=UPI00192ECD73|nr:increased DNA methylation 2-like [Eucalyptus grandis]